MRIGALARKASITTDMFDRSFKPDIETKLQMFADYGFRFIHWCDDWDRDVLYAKEDVELYRRLMESRGLRCIDVHAAETEAIHVAAVEEQSLDRYARLLENRIEFCSAVGGDAVVVHPPTDQGGMIDLDSKLDRSARVFEEVRSLCGDLGVAIAVENCHSTDEKILEYYFERYSPEFVGFCFDSGHAHLNQNLDQLLKFSSRLKALHLHDNRGKKDDHQPPFWGTIDWERVMRWIEGSGYTKPLNFEIMHDPTSFEGTMEEFLEYTVRSVRKTMALVGSRPRKSLQVEVSPSEKTKGE